MIYMLLWDRPTPTQFPANPVGQRTLALYNKCVTPVGLLTVVESSSKKTNCYLWLRSITFRSHLGQPRWYLIVSILYSITNHVLHLKPKERKDEVKKARTRGEE